MRVAFDARALERPELAGRGIGRYVASLLPELDRLGDVVPLHGLRRPPAPVRLAEGWEHALLARDVRAARADVLHTPTVDFVSLRPRVPYVVTVHDLVPLKRREYLRTGLKHRLRYAAVRRADMVIVPTRAVAGDVERLLGIGPDRIVVIGEAAAPVFVPAPEAHAALERLGLPEEFLLWVGGLDPPDPRKGVAELAHTVAAGDGLPLVLAGAVDPGTARLLTVPGRVLAVGRLPDPELAALYTAAAALVLPSDEEGFGLTPVEALACGTPVSAYASAAIAETLSDVPGVALVEPGDLPRLLAAAEALAGSRAEPLTRTWADVARATFATYAAVAASR